MGELDESGAEVRTSEPARWERAATVGLFVLLLAVPFVCFNWFATHDGLTYPVRAAEWSSLVRTEGTYPRWAASFYWGFGYPIFNYFPPLAYFLGHLLMLAGLQAPAAIRCIELATFPVAFLGLWRLARLFVLPRAAFVAAIAGMLAPYRMVDVFVRGDLAESLAFALVPFVLAEAVQCARRNRPEDGVKLAAALALVFFAHTLTSFMCAIALALYGGFELVRRRWGAFVRIGGWSAAGLLVSAASWAPAFIERKYVNVNVATHARDFYTYFWGDHFLEWWQRFDTSFGFGPSLPGPADRMNFMFSFVIFGGIVWAVASLGTAQGRRRYGLPLAAFAAVQFMTLEASRSLWAHLPFIPFFQFPWRFLILDTILGVIVLAKALEDLGGDRPANLKRPKFLVAAGVVTAGVAGVVWKTPWGDLSGPAWIWIAVLAAVAAALIAWRFRSLDRWALLGVWAVAVSVVASVVVHGQKTNIPAEGVWNNPSFTDPEVREQTTLRRHDGFMEPLQTTGTNEFLPLTADPPPTAEMRGVVQFEGQVDGGGYKVVKKSGTLRAWEIVAPQAEPVLLPVFFFPGWIVELNGQPAAAKPGRYGLMELQLPAGMNRVAIHYDGTGVQHSSELLSLVSAIALAGLWIRIRLRKPADI